MGRFLSAACLFALVGCQAAAAESPPAPAPSSSAARAEKAPKEHGTKGDPKGESEKEPAAKRSESGRAFVLPFVRESNEEDPADRARGFLRELLKDNGAFVRGHDPKYFKPFADGQKPRATLVTCSDSRVQSHAFDASPDNDLFTIRNIGNQMATAAGSVQYGVEHLKTPLLVILGHSGCGAVKAAMGDFSQQPAPIRRELETIDLSPIGAKAQPEKQEKPEKGAPAGEKHGDDKPKTGEGMSWIDAVVANVHHQVAAALVTFADPVATHDMIVVGAVYDFRNDMKRGNGSVNIVNVNGHTEPAKISAFLKALEEHPLAGLPGFAGGSVIRDPGTFEIGGVIR